MPSPGDAGTIGSDSVGTTVLAVGVAAAPPRWSICITKGTCGDTIDVGSIADDTDADDALLEACAATVVRAVKT